MINMLGYPEPEFAHQSCYEIEKIREGRYLEKDHTGRIGKDGLERFEKDTGFKLDLECLKPL